VLPSGHEVFTEAVLPVVRLSPGDPVVRGLSEPGAMVFLTLFDVDGLVAAAASAVPDDEGRFSDPLIDLNSGNERAPRPGERIWVNAPRYSHSVPVEPLVAWPFDSSGAVAGFTGPSLPVRALHRSDPWRLSASIAIVDGAADGLGHFGLVGPDGSASPVISTTVVADLPTGDEIHTVPTSTHGVVRLPIAYVP